MGMVRNLNSNNQENITGNQGQFTKVSSAKGSDTAKEPISRYPNKEKSIKGNTKMIAKVDLGCKPTRTEANIVGCSKTTLDTAKER